MKVLQKTIPEIDDRQNWDTETDVEYGSDTSELGDYDRELCSKIQNKEALDLSVSYINESLIDGM